MRENKAVAAARVDAEAAQAGPLRINLTFRKAG